MQVERYGLLENGMPIERCTTSSRRGMRAEILTYGGILAQFDVLGRGGLPVNIVIGLNLLQEYATCSPYFGAVVGCSTNRIAKGRFTLGGVEYRLACNDGPNALHCGPGGLSNRAWAIKACGSRSLTLACACRNGEEGYPGTLRVRVEYTLDDDALRLDHQAKTNAPTVLNIANQSYFNLGSEGSSTALDRELTIHAAHFTPVDGMLIPTGELLNHPHFSSTVLRPCERFRSTTILRFAAEAT